VGWHGDNSRASRGAVEVVASGGLVDILDATAGLTVTRLANVSALQVDPSS